MVMGYLLLKKGKSAPGTSGAPVLAKRGTPNGTCPASRASSSRPINGSPENRPTELAYAPGRRSFPDYDGAQALSAVRRHTDPCTR
jgi:hypothetical protein